MLAYWRVLLQGLAEFHDAVLDALANPRIRIFRFPGQVFTQVRPDLEEIFLNRRVVEYLFLDRLAAFNDLRIISHPLDKTFDTFIKFAARRMITVRSDIIQKLFDFIDYLVVNLLIDKLRYPPRALLLDPVAEPDLVDRELAAQSLDEDIHEFLMVMAGGHQIE